jgi:5-methyltetrahydrofolate--homocysteine methyltransferase
VRTSTPNKKASAAGELAEARANTDCQRLVAWRGAAPILIGRRVFRNYDLAVLAHTIDWGRSFLTGTSRARTRHTYRRHVGESERRVLSDGQRLLKRLIEGRWLTANGVIGLFPANTVNDDDIEVYADESRREVLMTWQGLRMQTERPVVDGVKRPNRCLADFVAPKGVGAGRPRGPVRRHGRHRRRQEGESSSSTTSTTTAPSC